MSTVPILLCAFATKAEAMMESFTKGKAKPMQPTIENKRQIAETLSLDLQQAQKYGQEYIPKRPDQPL